MKILMVNKFFYVKGGSETYYFALKRLLQEHGHTVVDFSMNDPKNLPSDFRKYFVRNIDYNNMTGVSNKVKAAIGIIYNLEARKKFEQLVIDTNPDIVHLHIFQHQLSPSILDIIKKYHLPTVYTAHDLKMICLNYKMMHHGHICEECKGKKYYRCAVNKCVKNSFSRSCVSVAEGYIHEWRHSYDIIDKIITPSNFYRKKFEEFGVRENRVIHIPNFLDEEPIVTSREDKEKYYLYFGRLSEEKGVLTLLKAFQALEVRLRVVGTGPLEDKIKAFIENKKMDNLELMGFMSGQPLKNMVGNAKAVILPSEWYENGPYSAIEALGMHRPIIGANIGGIPELIENNGYLFETGNPMDLTRKVVAMEKLSDAEYDQMKNNSYRIYLERYTKESHYKQIEKVYQQICSKG